MFTKQACQKGGWTRARQHAQARREIPTPNEKRVRDFLSQHGIYWIAEYEIVHPNGMPQFIDVYVPQYNMAIEVDGSHGWHGYNGIDTYGKMGVYDELKAKYCETWGIQLHRINLSDRSNYSLEKLLCTIQAISTSS